MRHRVQPTEEFRRINNYFPPDPPLPWRWIKERADRFLKPVETRWRRLLASKGTREPIYTQFLASYAGYFISSRWDSFFALSEVLLGSDYRIDLVVPHDRASCGLVYNLIEVEPPHVRPFKVNGDKSARLNHAIDQVENWKRWLHRNSGKAREMFPPKWFGDDEPQFTFTIVIGTRANTEPWIQRRNEISSKYQISIRSHDHLTDLLCQSDFAAHGRLGFGECEGRSISPIIKNAMGNPFFRAWSDAEWKAVRQTMAPSGHFFIWNADTIIANRSYNPLFEPFVRYCKRRLKEFPPDIRYHYECWSRQTPLRPDLGG